MRRFTTIIVMALAVALLILPAVVSADVANPDEVITVTKTGSQYQLNRTGDTPTNSVYIFVGLHSPKCENIIFGNATSGTVTIRNTSSPAGVSLKSDVVVNASQNSTPIPFCCGDDEGTWTFEVGDGLGGDPDAIFTIRLSCGKIPTLTPYGVMLLILLLAGTAVWVLRRRSAAPAM